MAPVNNERLMTKKYYVTIFGNYLGVHGVRKLQLRLMEFELDLSYACKGGRLHIIQLLQVHTGTRRVVTVINAHVLGLRVWIGV
jgi:hypothetical protein